MVDCVAMAALQYIIGFLRGPDPARLLEAFKLAG